MLGHPIPCIIDGESVMLNEVFDIISPDSGQTVHQCSLATVKIAKSATRAANNAAEAWRHSTHDQRRDIFLGAAELLYARQDELIAVMRAEIGASYQWAKFNVNVASKMLKGVVDSIGLLGGQVAQLADENTSGLVLLEPYGVVLAIAPWNAPYILGLRSFLFPIAAGCTVVFKGSELSPGVHYLLVDILHKAGIPKGVLNFIVTTPSNAASVTESLISDPMIRKINFTGSTAVGRIIGRLAGQYLKPTVMELGGKGVAIVWKDADLDLAAAQCAKGAFLFSGQICMSTEKILVHQDVAQEFQDKLLRVIGQSHGQQLLVLINRQSVAKNTRLLVDAVDKGAVLLCGDLAGVAETTRMQPAVVSKVTTDMDIYHTESFGPSVSLIEIATEKEAIFIANDTEYGLNSAVFTADLGRGMRLARNIRCGAVHINSMTVHDENALPHGGTKCSGWGRFNGLYGLHEWVQTKSVTWRN